MAKRTSGTPAKVLEKISEDVRAVVTSAAFGEKTRHLGINSWATSPAELDAYYRARRSFDRLLRSPEFEVRFRLAPGELLMMDNRRLLHGRTGFDPGEGARHLQGCYIDIDGPRSLYRVLRRRLRAAEAE